jgi:lipopolysaccharide assembly LptE-like protein
MGPLIVAFLLFAAGCAGPYRVGNNTLFPADVRTVCVPMFESESFRRYLGERLTEAVCKQVETDTPFKVVTGNADSVLSGRIVQATKRTIVENRFDDPRDTELNLQVVVTWANRRGEIIAQQTVGVPQVLVNPPASVDIGARSDIVPEFGRSVATEQQAAIDKLARQIVGLMETPW